MEEEIIERFEKMGFLSGLENKKNTALAMDYALKIDKGDAYKIMLELPILRKIFAEQKDNIDSKIILTIVNEVSKVLEPAKSIINIRKKMYKYSDVESVEPVYCAEVADKFKIKLNEILNEKTDN